MINDILLISLSFQVRCAYKNVISAGICEGFAKVFGMYEN